MFADGVDAGAGAWTALGATLGGAGSEKSKISFKALVVVGLVGAGADAKLKSPKSFEALGVKLACGN